MIIFLTMLIVIFPIISVIIGYILDEEKIIIHHSAWWLYGFICGIIEAIIISISFMYKI